MNASAAPDHDIERQAQDWALAVFGERLSAERAAELRDWINADPRHALAYDRAEQLMLALCEVESDEADQVSAEPRLRRGWALKAAMALAACLVIGVGVVALPKTLESGGQVRTIALSDGSTATLAPQSRLRQNGWGLGRRYALERGEALFDVRHAEGRPFQVDVGETRVTVLGTRFEVRRASSGEVGVAVARGRVAVQGAALNTILTRGDNLIIDATSTRRARLADPEAVADWRRGQLSYDSARLSDVTADIRRFSAIRVEADPRLAGVRLTASFRADQASAFVASLPALLPVEVRPRADGVLVIAPRGE